MKFLASLMFFVSFSVSAQSDKLIKEISRHTVTIPVKMSQDTIRCSAVGYGMPELKIDVPALDYAASFQHRNFGEGQPCMTAGRCDEVGGPEVILSGGEEEITTELTVIHQEVAWLDEVRNTCFRQIEEHLEMNVRGHIFTHKRAATLNEISADLCKKVLQ